MKSFPSKSNSQLSAEIHLKKICSEYGLFGNFFYYSPSPIVESDRNRLYFIAGTDPALGSDVLPAHYFPEDLLRHQKRCSKLFYPQVYVMDFTKKENHSFSGEELVEYCKKAEFLQSLYGQYGLELPTKLRLSEIHQLSEFYDLAHNSLADPRLRRKCQRDLDWFFAREKTTGLRKAWLDYFRSEKFPDDGSPFRRIFGFLQRRRQCLNLDQMLDSTQRLHKLVMQEHEFRYFAKFMREIHPEVTYCCGPKEVINNGIHNSKESESFLGKRISGEEYAALRMNRFAREGWESVVDYNQAYYEFRDVYYKACDEPLVASVYNSITLAYAKCDPLEELTRLAEQSPLCLADISVGDFMNFVSLAKANHLRFYIDNIGQFALPSLDKVRVIYNEHQKGLLESIVERMMDDKVAHSHITGPKEIVSSLSETIGKAEWAKSLVPTESNLHTSHERE